MRREAAAALAALGAAALLAGGLAGPAGAEEPGPDGPPARLEVSDAVLRWGVNHESSNRAHAPDTFNFLAAGRVPDPGRGGSSLPRRQWKQRAGAVRIQKWDGRAWRAATWQGLSTDAAGRPLGSPASGSTSGLRFTVGSGAGYVDRAAGTAHVAWDGDLTVVYYSGMSMFHVSDPVLDVADGRGTLTATVSGYASSVEDPGAWAPVPGETVTLADLPGIELGEDGLSATPAYLGVPVEGLGQTRGEEWSGSFPPSFVRYMDRLGTAAFWFSSGSSTDPFKVPLPLSVGYDAAAEDPTPTPTGPPTQPAITNPTVAPPTATPPPTPPPTAPPTVPAPTAPAAPAPLAGAVPAAGAPVPTAPAPGSAPVPVAGSVAGSVAGLPAAAQLVAAPAAGPDEAPGARWAWWVGGALLLAAALVLLLPSPRRARVA